jgi:predicted porin
VAGFQAGVSFTPDTGDQGDNERLTGNQNGDIENSFGLGLNYVGEFGWGDLGLAAVGFIGNGEDTRNPQPTGTLNSSEDAKSAAVGGTLGFGNLSFGGSYMYDDDRNQRNHWTAGVGYSFGAVNTSLTYNGVRFDDNNEPDTADRDIFVLSADTGLMPGVTLAGDLGYAIYSDESTDDNGGYDSNDVVAGVVKLNLAF